MYLQEEKIQADDLLLLIRNKNINKAFIKALELNKLYPDNSLINNFLGSHYLNEGNLPVSEKYLTAAYSKNTNNLDIHYNLAVLSKNQFKYLKSELHLKKCFDLSNDDDYLFLLSKLYFEKLKFFDKSIEILSNLLKKETKFDKKQIYHLLALNYEYNFQFQEAQKYHNKARSLANTQEEEINFDIVLVRYFRKVGNYLEAEEILKKLKKKYPKNSKIFFSSGIFYRYIGDYDQSKQDFLYSINLKSKDQSLIDRSIFNYGCTLISNKELNPGWKSYALRELNPLESNFKNKIMSIKELADKTKLKKEDKLLIWTDQGYGDNIFFFRFLKKINKNNLFFISKKNDFNFFQKNNLGIKIIQQEEFLINNFQFNYQINISNIPAVFDLDVPVNDELIDLNVNDVSKAKSLLSNNSKPNIGIAWSGNPEYEQDYSRSILFNTFKKIIDDQQFNFYCLQKDIQPRDMKSFELSGVKYLGNLDFYDTACFVKNLNLVITTDTSLVHLCGFLNLNTVLLLSKFPDWRWIEKNQTGQTPWYETVKFIKQSIFGDWNSVFNLVNKELQQLKK